MSLEKTEKIAVPTAGGKLCAHFGHCEQFTFFTISDGKVIAQETLTPPPHAPGIIPNWLAGQGCSLLLAGGIGETAQQILTQRGVKVLCGAPSAPPEEVVSLYLEGKLTNKHNVCDHGHHGHGCGH
ncbi:NifB/NifX family molybdenum-iron cluster-binding protein [Sporolituus thermophilus]|uniref:Predicted Fe-Mo cluster-binding protein, NifX family n=1 Tax=Sporolituus thermophilus DSM 23256 TaxID=1123285 RepID=A0A1G7NWK6_9FIRM|nr:NifB/NifX family molybdenum-iron cluster-binding protein [Sporolituus thermophilus]SDF78425.1 Predicted Fe-Mo cluster-binding protein, NifX family [Sporolituus thermophilus DSM 23256]